jgi:CRISPR-associated endoribonuclease Cas6
MRVRIIFALKNKGGVVPFHHQNLLAGFIQHHLLNTPQHDYLFFNFSGLKGQTRVSRLGLHFYSSKITLVVSSLSKDWIDALVRAILLQKEVSLGNLQLLPEYAEIEEAPTFEESMKYVCISPIAITGADADNYNAKKFVAPEEDAFSDLLYDVLMKRMEASGLYTAEQLANFYKFQVVPDKQYLQKIREDDKKFARIYTIQEGRNRHEFRGYTFPFMLYADPVVQKFIFECGLGYHTHEGFGMIDTIHHDIPKNTLPYSVA